MNQTEKHCQSCGMPMGETNELFGTEADGSKSQDYCHYCYGDGKFLKEETMEQMIESCIPFTLEDGVYQTADEARESLTAFYPSLKRWAKAV